MILVPTSTVAEMRLDGRPAMEMIDLSREIYHRTQTHPSHPPVVMTTWNDHTEKKVAGNTTFTSKAPLDRLQRSRRNSR